MLSNRIKQRENEFQTELAFILHLLLSAFEASAVASAHGRFPMVTFIVSGSFLFHACLLSAPEQVVRGTHVRVPQATLSI